MVANISMRSYAVRKMVWLLVPRQPITPRPYNGAWNYRPGMARGSEREIMKWSSSEPSEPIQKIPGNEPNGANVTRAEQA